MSPQVHRVSHYDEQDQTVVCAHCGTVPVAFVYDRRSGELRLRPRCSVGRKEQKYRNRENWPSELGRVDPRLGHGLSTTEARAYKEGKSCEICGSTHRLAVDHCHKTGVIRGVLCGLHNRILGALGDDLEGVMGRIAQEVVLFLGRITFGTLHLFEKLGVDMARVDETLASWTAWSENIKTQLAAALAEAQNLRDTDAAEDAAQANALSESLADKVQAAFDAVSQPPSGGGGTDPATDPATDPVTEEPAPDTSTEPVPAEPPAPFDPTTGGTAEGDASTDPSVNQ